MNKAPSIKELINRLGVKKTPHLGINEPKIIRTLNTPITTPLFLIALETIGSFFTTVFLLWLLHLLELLDTSAERTKMGLLLTLSGLIFHHLFKKFNQNTYFKHITLYIIVAGNTILFDALYKYLDFWFFLKTLEKLVYYPISIPLIAITLPMYLLFKNQAYRFFSAFACFSIFGFETLQKMPPIVFTGYLIALLIGSGTIMTQQRFPLSLKTLGYAAVAAIITNLIILDARDLMPSYSTYYFSAKALWLLHGAFTLSLFYLIYTIAGEKSCKSPWVYCIPLILVMGLLLTPGLLFALMLLIAGYGYYERILSVSGLILFPAFLFHYYYSLHASLLNKSLLLMSSGALLILLSLFLHRAQLKRNESL